MYTNNASTNKPSPTQNHLQIPHRIHTTTRKPLKPHLLHQLTSHHLHTKHRTQSTNSQLPQQPYQRYLLTIRQHLPNHQLYTTQHQLTSHRITQQATITHHNINTPHTKPSHTQHNHNLNHSTTHRHTHLQPLIPTAQIHTTNTSPSHSNTTIPHHLTRPQPITSPHHPKRQMQNLNAIHLHNQRLRTNLLQPNLRPIPLPHSQPTRSLKHHINTKITSSRPNQYTNNSTNSHQLLNTIMLSLPQRNQDPRMQLVTTASPRPIDTTADTTSLTTDNSTATNHTDVTTDTNNAKAI